MKTTSISLVLIAFLVILMCGCSSIVDVARQGDIDELKKRVNKGENINQSDDRVTAIEAAVEQGNSDIAKYLIDNGAKINLDTMHIAIKRGHYDIVGLLIENGISINDMKYACINTKSGINEKQKVGWGPVTWAIRYKQPKILRLLIELGGDCQAKFVIKNSWPCIISSEVNTIVIRGANPRHEEWSTPLELAQKIAAEFPNSTAAAENYQTIKKCCCP
jgi:hypothetical protein